MPGLALAVSERGKRDGEELPIKTDLASFAQTRRAAVSVAANVAEGYARRTDGDLARFLRIAQGSLAEVETCVLRSVRLCCGDATTLIERTEEVGRLVSGLYRVENPLVRRRAEPQGRKRAANEQRGILAEYFGWPLAASVRRLG